MEYIIVLLIFGAILISSIERYNQRRAKKYQRDERSENEYDAFEEDKEVDRLIRDRRKMAAIRKYKKDHHTSTLEAKKYVDELSKNKKNYRR